MKYTIWFYSFLSLVIFTLSACVNPNITPAVSSTAVSRLTCKEINLQPVVLGEDGPLTPGSEVILSAQSALPDVTLAWQAESGADYLSVSGDTLTAVYIVPDDRTSDTVTVSVAGLGCPTPLSIDILLPTATHTAVPSATPTPRPENTATPLPTFTPTATQPPTSTPCHAPKAEIDSNNITSLYVNEQIELTAVTDKENLLFNWEAENGTIVPNDKNTTLYTAAGLPGTDKITLNVTNQCGESTAATIELDVNQITAIAPPLPTYTAPQITNLEILPGGTLDVQWTWNHSLAADQNFAVRLWLVNSTKPEARYSLTWTREQEYQIKVDNTRFPKGDYYLNIAVMTGQSDGEHSAVVESEPMLINIPNIDPRPDAIGGP